MKTILLFLLLTALLQSESMARGPYRGGARNPSAMRKKKFKSASRCMDLSGIWIKGCK